MVHHSSLEASLRCDKICQEVPICLVHCLESKPSDKFESRNRLECILLDLSPGFEAKREVIPHSLGHS